MKIHNQEHYARHRYDINENLSFFVFCHSHKIKLAGLSKTNRKIREKVTKSHCNNQYDCTNPTHSLTQTKSRYGIKNFLFVANLL